MRCRADCPSTASRPSTTRRAASHPARWPASSRSSWTSSAGNGSSKSGSAPVGMPCRCRRVAFADAARLPFVSGSFDVATTNHVLHLIPDWRDVLREIARVTRETYFTVIERSERVDTLKREYDALVKDAGHAWSHPGFHEKDLPTLLKPDFVMPVGPFRETLLANSILEELNRRTYSSQWDVPEEIHRDAIERLRTNWKGKEFQVSHTLEITFWRSERLPEMATAQRS